MHFILGVSRKNVYLKFPFQPDNDKVGFWSEQGANKQFDLIIIDSVWEHNKKNRTFSIYVWTIQFA